MIGVNPPGHFLYADAQTRWTIAMLLFAHRTRPCGARTDDLAASMRRTAAAMPERWLLPPINPSNVRVVTFFGLAESTPMMAPPSSAGPTLDAWLSAAEGDPTGFWIQSFVGAVAPR